MVNPEALEKTQKWPLLGTPRALCEADFPNENSYNIS